MSSVRSNNLNFKCKESTPWGWKVYWYRFKRITN